jgi:phenylacetic acid degradation operon negative regulatory protein
MAQSRNATAAVLEPGRTSGRPLSARSVMASLLLGRRSGARNRDLIRWCGLFGISPGTARVALHRMTAASELRRDGDRYELVGNLARRREEQEAALVPDRRPWDGGWRMAVAVGSARAAPVRAEMRTAFRRARLAEWREGVWLRPDNVEILEDPRAAWVDARPDGDPVALAAGLFGPAEWNRDAASLLDRLSSETARLEHDADDAIASAFLAGAATLRHIRSDPQLPDELLPGDWLGGALRAQYVHYESEFSAVARDWFRRQ